MEYYYKNHQGHVSLADLNHAYGHNGKTFDSAREAVKFEKGLKNGGYITRVINYNPHELTIIKNACGPIEGAEPHTKAWLVTIIPDKEIKIGYRY